MPTIANFNTVAISTINKINTVAKSSLTAWNGLTIPAAGYFNNVQTNGVWVAGIATTESDFAFTPSAAGTEETFTFSAWVKLLNNNIEMNLLNSGTAGTEIKITTTNQLQFTTATANLITTNRFIDPSGFYHFVVAVDTTQATASNRVKIYVNGTQLTSFSTETYPDQNEVTDFLKTNAHHIASDETPGNWLDAVLADVVLIDGTQYAASDFGEYATVGDSTADIWIPKNLSGLTFGTQGSWLRFQNSADFGEDSSGNDNDWTLTNISATNYTLDRPEENYLSCAHGTSSTDSNRLRYGGMSANYSSGGDHGLAGTWKFDSGKWYLEQKVIAYGAIALSKVEIGLLCEGFNNLIHSGTLVGGSAYGYGLQADPVTNTKFFISSGGVTTDSDNLGAPADGDVLMMAVDFDAGKIWFGVNGTWGDFGATGVGDPANGTNPAFTLNSDQMRIKQWVVQFAGKDSYLWYGNAGQFGFAYTPPTGFLSPRASNITAPTVGKFAETPTYGASVVIYTGSGAEKAVTGVDFQPDIVWIKNRTAADPHHVFNSVVGATSWLEPDSNAVEQTDAQTLKSFDSDGFTLGTDAEVNTNAENFFAWCFKEGASFGIDIVTYTGNGAAQAIGHNLGAVPEMMLVKRRASVANQWGVYHHTVLSISDPWTDYANLDDNGAFLDLDTYWNDTAPTSTQFTVGTTLSVDTGTYVAFLFRSIPGFSHVGVYDGLAGILFPYVRCGFKPKMIMFKNYANGLPWILVDAPRNPAPLTFENNVVADLPNAETVPGSSDRIFPTANGFILGLAAVSWNQGGYPFPFIAFADIPFKYSNAVYV